MKRKRSGRPAALIMAAVVAAVLLWFFSALNGIQAGQGEEGRRQLETAIRRAAVACYAAEGVYPPDLGYLTEHYGIRVNEEQYIVFYDVFADNLMPDITVLIKDET